MNRGLTIFMGDREIWFHETVVNSWIIVLVLTCAAVFIRKKIKKTDPMEKPKGIVHLMEILVEGIDGLTIQTMGEENLHFAPYMMSLAVFLVFANLWGLVGFSPPTSDYNVTLALALITFAITHLYSVKTVGLKNYLKGFAEPVFIILPINVLGDLAAPISLSFRLFGNVLSGALTLSLVYGALSGIGSLITPIIAAPLHAYFDVFSGLLQTLIFIMLSMTYIKNKV